MSKIMEIIEKETGGKSYHTYKYSYDTVGIPGIDYDDSPDRIMKWQETAETERHKESVDIKPLADQIRGSSPLLTYFLDGSRHVFKVDDMAYNKQVYPVVAGQIGVGCCKRANKKMSVAKFYRELVLTLPDKANADGWDDKAFFSSKVSKINNSSDLKKLGLEFEEIIPYSTSKAGSADTKLEDRAIGVIQDYMIEAEKRMVAELVKEKCLNQDNYLVKDGSLEYKILKSGREDLRTLQKIKNNYRWVIGISKSFNPESLLDHTGKPNSNYIANLPVFHRTPVARYTSGMLGDVQFGVWYVRLRDKSRTQTPFDGVVKVEKILMDDEIEPGLDSDVVDLLTANILNERNPTCYGKDKRWANHLYISLTDIAKYRSIQPSITIHNWLRGRDVVEFLGLWESLHNPEFKLIEFDKFKKDAGTNAYVFSIKDWTENLGAIGLKSKSGRYGGIYAHIDIAFEFASWISPEFKLYIIKDYQRLKYDENSRLSLSWNLNREVAKLNYRIHTDAIQEHLTVPELTQSQKSFIYANEADMLNVVLFGKTAREWKCENPNKKGNM